MEVNSESFAVQNNKFLKQGKINMYCFYSQSQKLSF